MGAIAAVDAGADFRNLLKCPRCRRDGTLGPSGDAFSCRACVALVPIVGGVVDFVGGRTDTALDVEAYDGEKGVTLAASLELFVHLRRRAGGALSVPLGDVLEVGAGTGLLTLGLLRESMFDRAVITDVSPRMLALCRERVASELGTRTERVLFATYGATEPILADARYGLCIGNSVVHHILDYRAFFADIRRALKPGGTAIFVEPGAPYHQAMMHAMVAGLDEIGRNGADAERLGCWISDVRLRLSCPPEKLALLEDKHLFQRDDLARAAEQAGFGSIRVVPSLLDPDGLVGAQDYLRALGVSQEFCARYLPVYGRHAALHFRGVDQSDLSGMHLIILQR